MAKKTSQVWKLGSIVRHKQEGFLKVGSDLAGLCSTIEIVIVKGSVCAALDVK